MTDAIFRQWLMLKNIPRYPRFIDGADLDEVLKDNGVTIPRRYVQRDLLRLQKIFPSLKVDDSKKPYRWYFEEHAPAHVPGLDPKTAVALRVVDKYLKRALPRGALRGLEGHFRDAEKTLKHGDTSFANWEKRVRVITRSLPLKAPDVPTAARIRAGSSSCSSNEAHLAFAGTTRIGSAPSPTDAASTPSLSIPCSEAKRRLRPTASRGPHRPRSRHSARRFQMPIATGCSHCPS